MVLESPLSVVVDLMMELFDSYKICLPKFTFAIQIMRRAIQKKAKFDTNELNAVKDIDPGLLSTDEDYQYEDLTGFPCSMEEEEKMFMEAVMASLKDSETHGPRSEDSDSSQYNRFL